MIPSQLPGGHLWMMRKSDSFPRRLNLALQGGGAHGAFTWGVLDRLLEDGRFEIGWVSGASAGAINAAALASGLATSGATGARECLAALWGAVARGGVPDLLRLNPFLASSIASLGRSNAFSQVTGRLSPYDFNPLNLDPFRRMLDANVDTARVRATPGPELLITATHIATGRARHFRRAELSTDVLLASACLPTLHHAVEIDGEAYWDGGFSANPDLLTLATESPVGDTLIVQLNPMVRPGVPTSTRAIAAHMSELAFHRPYVGELEAILRHRSAPAPKGIARLFTPQPGARTRIARHRFHLIEAGRITASLSSESKGRPEQALIDYLFQAGRIEASKWLERHAADVGMADTADIEGRLARLAALSAQRVPEAAA
jgi:NTE family protein